MLLIYVITLFFAFAAISEVKECRRKAAEKREREEEREIIRKIKAEDIKEQSKDNLDAEFGKKYNIDLKKSSTHNYETHKIIPIL